MKKNMKKILAFLCAVVLFVTAVFTEHAMNQAQAEDTSTTEATPVTLDGFRNVTLGHFVDASGKKLTDGDYSFSTGVLQQGYELKNKAGFDDTLFSAKVKFSYTSGVNAWHTRLHVGGSTMLTGLAVFANEAGDTLTIKEVNPKNMNLRIKEEDIEYTVSNVTADVTSFYNTEFLLQMSYEYEDFDSDGAADDIRLGVYINGNQVIYDIIENCNMNVLGSYIGFYHQEAGCTIKVNSVEIVPEPVTLDGFRNVTLGHFVDASGKKLTDGDYSFSTGVLQQGYELKNKAGFDDTLFSAKVKFSYTSGVNAWHTRLHVGGSTMLTGLAVFANEAGDTLTIKEVNGGDNRITAGAVEYTVSDVQADVTSFYNTEFLLQMSYEYEDFDSDGAADDIRLGVYINGNRVKYEIIYNCNMDVLGSYIGFYHQEEGCTITVNSVNILPEPVTLTGFRNVTISDFVDASGNKLADGDYSFSTGVLQQGYELKNKAGFDDTLFSAKVKFSYTSGVNAWHTRLHVGGSTMLTGLAVFANEAGDTLTIKEVNGGDNRITAGAVEYTVSDVEADVTSFYDTEFLLQMSYEYEDFDGDGATDIRLGVYINGNRVKYKIISNCNMDVLGSYIGFYHQEAGCTITVNSVEIPIEPVTLTGFKNVTINDFADASGNELADGVYSYSEGVLQQGYELKNKTGFDHTLFTTKVKFSYTSGVNAWHTRLHVGGKNATTGLAVFANEAGDTLTVKEVNPKNMNLRIKEEDIEYTVSNVEADVTSFYNTEFLLQMSYEYEDFDGDGATDIQLGVYINGIRVIYKIISNCNMNVLGSYIGFYHQEAGCTITVNSVELPEREMIQPDETLTKLTFGSFGIADGTYTQTKSGTWTEQSDIDGTLICGKVKFDQGAQILLGITSPSVWTGFRLMLDDGDTMRLTWYNGTTLEATYKTFKACQAGKEGISSFLNQSIDLMISTEVVDYDGNGSEDDIKIGVWFNGYLYQDSYIFIKDRTTFPANTFGVYSGGTYTLNSVKELLTQPSESYDKVTFHQFGIADGTYDATNAGFVLKNDFKKKDNLDKTVLCGKVLLTGASNNTFNVLLGDKGDDPLNGMKLWINSSTMTLNLGTTITNVATIDSKTAGVGDTFVNNPFDFMWSVEFIDKNNDGNNNDIKVGLWFNGFLYNNTYYVMENGGTADELGNKFSVYCEAAGTSVTINSYSELMKLPADYLQKLSLPDFVHDGTDKIMGSSTYREVKKDGFVLSGNAKKYDTLAGKAVSFDVLQTGVEESSFTIALGGTTHGAGLHLVTESDGRMSVGWKKADATWIGKQTVDINDATVSSLINETFNLIVSMELVDENDNGTDDVKVCIWFNEILYNHDGEEYFIFTDCGTELGNKLSVSFVDGADVKEFVSLRTVAEYQSNPYYYEDITAYRGTTYIAPEEEGKVFSGWYKDEAYTEPVDTTTKDGAAYAKFVDDEVLSVKVQVQLDEATNQIPTDKTALRFVTSVDSLYYRQIAFKFAIAKADGTYGAENSTATTDENGRKVYTKLSYIGPDEEEMSYQPTAFSWMSQYFKAWTLSGIPANYYDRDIKVTAYWITLDGTTVRGTTKYVTVNEGEPGESAEKSKAVTLDFLGENEMPVVGYGIWPALDENDSLLFPDYITKQYFEMFADAGINLMGYSQVDYATEPKVVEKQLELGAKYGIGVLVNDSTLLTIANGDSSTKESDISAQLKKYSDKKAFSGIHLVDEPSMGEGGYAYDESRTGKVYTNYETLAGFLPKNCLTYTNLYPMTNTWKDSYFQQWDEATRKYSYTTYVEKVSETLQPQVISWDHYLFDEDYKVDGDYDYKLYFWNMDLIRKQAQTDGKAFWAFIQAGSQWNNDGTQMQTETYYPSESQFKWNVNTSLAFGAQGIQYFPLIQPKQFSYDGIDADRDFERNGLLSAWGGKTQWYYYAQEINKQIEAIDEVLMNSVNEGVIASGTAADHTSGLSSIVTSYEKLNAVSDGNAMVGCFNYNEKTALYVVNYNMDDAVQKITLTFDKNYSNIKMTKNATTTYNNATTNNKLVLQNMEPGEGILLIIE